LLALGLAKKNSGLGLGLIPHGKACLVCGGMLVVREKSLIPGMFPTWVSCSMSAQELLASNL